MSTVSHSRLASAAFGGATAFVGGLPLDEGDSEGGHRRCVRAPVRRGPHGLKAATIATCWQRVLVSRNNP